MYFSDSMAVSDLLISYLELQKQKLEVGLVCVQVSYHEDVPPAHHLCNAVNPEFTLTLPG